MKTIRVGSRESRLAVVQTRLVADYIQEALPEAERLALSNSLSGMRRYSEMQLKILKAEQLVGGEEAMDRILRGLFNRELDPMYPYLTYQEFLDACGLTEEDFPLLENYAYNIFDQGREPFRLQMGRKAGKRELLYGGDSGYPLMLLYRGKLYGVNSEELLQFRDEAVQGSEEGRGGKEGRARWAADH